MNPNVLWERFKEDLSSNVLAALIVAIGIVTAAVCVGNTLMAQPAVFAPLSVSDVTINSRLDGLDGPAVLVGEHYNGTITICNSDDEEQVITFVIQFERLMGPVHFVSDGSMQFPIGPGCATFTGESFQPLPDEVTPGQWRESTAAVVQRGDQKQTVSFVSEPFEVVNLHDLIPEYN